MSKYSVENLDNYNVNYKDDIDTIYRKYELLIEEYINHCSENIYGNNEIYNKYILEKGINTITHVFKFLLLYTKNLDLVYHNCQKSYIYYIEFIGQIGQESHSFLQLTSNDAMLFVYKKTIFDIPNSIIKNISNNKVDENISNNIELILKIHNNLLSKYINNNKIVDIEFFLNNELEYTILKILKVNNKANNDSRKILNLELIIVLIEYIKKNDIIEIINLFVKKLSKNNNLNVMKLKNALLNIENRNNATTLIKNIFDID